jgi:hypothetical protein
VPAKLLTDLASALYLLIFPSITNGKGMHLQETSLDAPLSGAMVNHKRCAEAEHDSNQIRRCEGPCRSAGSQALGWYFGGVGIADSRCTGGRESS